MAGEDVSLVDRIFGRGSGEGSGDAGAGDEAKPSGDQTEAKADEAKEGGDRPDWVPENFWKEGQLDARGMAQSWKDGRAEVTRVQQRLKDLEKAASGGDLPKTAEEYWRDQEWGEIEKRAPNAWSLASGNEQKDMRALLTAAHRNGVAPDRARAILADYLELMEPNISPMLSKSPEERRKAAEAGQGVHGPEVAKRVYEGLKAAEQSQEFTDEQVQLLEGLTQSATGLGLLYRLVQRGGGGPPANTGNGYLDVGSEEADLRKFMRETARNRTPAQTEEIERRFEAVRARGGFKKDLALSGPPFGIDGRG